MTAIEWDTAGSRTYEGGIDRGVLYLKDGTTVPWNGLVAVSENATVTTESIFYDGRKINELARQSSFAATIRAITYPEEFLRCEGIFDDSAGLAVTEQIPERFDLCYRTMIGNDLDEDAGYKIHVVYNLTAVPATKVYRTMSLDSTPAEFSWTVKAIPENIPGYRPTAHVIIDTRKVAPWFIADVEEILYGSYDTDPFLPSLESFSAFLRGYDRIVVFDNGDGTWTVSTDRENTISEVGGVITIVDANTANETVDQYDISSTDKEELWQQ